MKKSAITRVNELLQGSKKKPLKAAACTFYVPDPWWKGELRLLSMCGVKHKEPMYGFLWPLPAKEVVTEGLSELFIPDARGAKKLRRPTSALLQQLQAKSQLFGDFIEREGIVSCARLIFRKKEQIHAVLFINFDRLMNFDSETQSLIKRLMADLIELLPAIDKELRSTEDFPVASLLDILSPLQQIASIKDGENEELLVSHLRDILTRTMNAFDIVDAQSGIGTIHLYDSESNLLKLMAHVGEIDSGVPTRYRRHSLAAGEGIVTWVAAKRQPLLIMDLAHSPFADFHIPIMRGVCSELAVPMLAGDELVGVLNVETRKRLSTFSPIHVRLLWYAANQAAIVCQLFQQAQFSLRQSKQNDKLLQICSEASRRRGLQPLDDMAKLACEFLNVHKFTQAYHCDIWRFDKSRLLFQGVGANYPEFRSTHPPREKGWTAFVHETGRIVWLDQIQSINAFRVHFWDAEHKTWQQDESRRGPPQLSTVLLDLPVKAELGVPIVNKSEPVGVLWIKFSDRKSELPTPEEMDLAVGFVGGAAMVLKCVHSDDEIQKAEFDGMRLILRVLRHEILGKILDKMVVDLAELNQNQTNLIQIKTNWPVLLDFVRAVVDSLRLYDADANFNNLTVNKEQLDLRSLAEQAIQLANLVQKKPPCDNRIDGDLTVFMDGQYGRLLLFNLLHNAKKFTPSSRRTEPVVISASRSGADGVTISVDDAGYGIPEDIRGRIGKDIGLHFDPPGAVISGSGFGLYLCNLIVQAHRGRMMPPEPSKRGGTCFRFFFPFKEEKNDSSIDSRRQRIQSDSDVE